MTLVQCPGCQQPVSDLAPACPRCGPPLKPAAMALRDGYERLRFPQAAKLYEAARPGGAEMGLVPAGDGVTVLTRKEGWLFVQDDSGTEGWTKEQPLEVPGALQSKAESRQRVPDRDDPSTSGMLTKQSLAARRTRATLCGLPAGLACGLISAFSTHAALTGWMIGAIAFLVVYGIAVQDSGPEARARTALRARQMQWDASPQNWRIWIREYKNARDYQRDASLMVANGWLLNQQSQGKNMGLGGALVAGAAFGMAGLMHGGTITVSWTRSAAWSPPTQRPV
jgi:hypothetical protein